MKCSKCGKDIKTIRANLFNYDGGDSYYNFVIEEVPDNAVYFDTDSNWTGYELTDEERKERIQCPECGKYPFDEKPEIQVYDIVRVVCFKEE